MHMSVLVTQPAPDFTAAAAMPDGSIKEDFKLSDLRGKYVVLFFWPLDFTFVCPSEIIAHDHRIAKFKELGVEVVGVSIDSQFTHYAWRNTPVPKRAASVRYSSPWSPTSSMKSPRLTASNIRPASPCAVPS
jgi:peroxiredoxin (alkyl hydroperoxide reductase subunit C)